MKFITIEMNNISLSFSNHSQDNREANSEENTVNLQIEALTVRVPLPKKERKSSLPPSIEAILNEVLSEMIATGDISSEPTDENPEKPSDTPATE